MFKKSSKVISFDFKFFKRTYKVPFGTSPKLIVTPKLLKNLEDFVKKTGGNCIKVRISIIISIESIENRWIMVSWN